MSGREASWEEGGHSSSQRGDKVTSWPPPMCYAEPWLYYAELWLYYTEPCL